MQALVRMWHLHYRDRMPVVRAAEKAQRELKTPGQSADSTVHRLCRKFREQKLQIEAEVRSAETKPGPASIVPDPSTWQLRQAQSLLKSVPKDTWVQIAKLKSALTGTDGSAEAHQIREAIKAAKRFKKS
jgi:hypothetical protein